MTQERNSAVALDAMGGDNAPEVTVQGAIEAAEMHGVEVFLVGREDILTEQIGSRSLPAGVHLVDAPEVVTMDDSPLVVLRKKKRSSLNVCAELVAEGRAGAMVSAGNTGAAWLSAKRFIGMIDGIDRPALAATFPHLSGHTLVLDVGANLECKPRNILEFAIMGSDYAEAVMDIEHPRVGLMSVGEEEGKGGKRIREWTESLSGLAINFVGNVEGRDVFSGDVDVIVCDGFVGNVVLKVAESMGEMIMRGLLEESKRSPRYMAGMLLAKGAIKGLRKRLDYAEYGGAPLLGVNGGCFIGHGRSDAKSVRNAIRFASAYAISGTIDRIQEQVAVVSEDEDEAETVSP